MSESFDEFFQKASPEKKREYVNGVLAWLTQNTGSNGLVWLRNFYTVSAQNEDELRKFWTVIFETIKDEYKTQWGSFLTVALQGKIR